jgi:hypothetical protein
MFKFGAKNKKLYKIVYKPEYGKYVDSCTLLIPGYNPTNAVEGFYKRVGLKVSSILEFTEITYPSELKKEEAEF